MIKLTGFKQGRGLWEKLDKVIDRLANCDPTDIEEVAEKLEREGIDKFIKPWLELIGNVEAASK